MKKIYIFTLNGCNHCREIKNKLKELDIPFNDIEITLNRDLWNRIIEQTKEDIVPTVFIQKDSDGSGVVYIPGRDFESVEQIIDIIKTNI